MDLRQMLCELNVLSRSDGSAMLTQGNTAVLVGVNGPIEVKLQNLQIDKASVEVAFRPKAGLPSVTDRHREQIIRNTVETAVLTTLYPRTSISVQVQEMEDHGGLIACAINASSLALLTSGISLKFVIAGVHCILSSEQELILDPNQKQCKDSIASFTYVFDSKNKNLIAATTSGLFSNADYNDSLLLCRSASSKIFGFFKEVMSKCSTEL